MKAATCHSEKSVLHNLFQQKQLNSSSSQRSQPLVKNLTKTCPWSKFCGQPFSKLNNFSLCTKRCYTTLKPKFLHMILQSLQFLPSHIIIPWGSYTIYALGACWKPKFITSRGPGHPNPYDTFLQGGNTPCLNTRVGSVRYLNTLLSYTQV